MGPLLHLCEDICVLCQELCVGLCYISLKSPAHSNIGIRVAGTLCYKSDQFKLAFVSASGIGHFLLLNRHM